MIDFIKQLLTALTGVLSGIILVYGLTHGGITQAQTVTTCDLINNQEQMVVFFAPIDTPTQIKDILLQGEPHINIGFSNGFFHIQYDDNERGWIRFHTRIQNGACTTYIENPPPDTPINEFPTLCLYTIDQSTTGYTDPTLTQQHGGFGQRPSGTYAVTEIIGNAVGLAGNSDMSGGYINSTIGTFSGHCDGTIQLATTTENARIWSQPSTLAGQVITTLDLDTEVGVLDGPVSGNIQDNILEDWYQVTTGDIQGWIWVDRLTFERTFTTPQPNFSTAQVTENARLWSEPNAKTGDIITSFPIGTVINIIGNAQIGFLQYDTDLTGNWYPVQIGGNLGWLYEGRIDFTQN